MRRLLALLLLPAMTLPALADDVPKQDKPPAHHTRLTAEERFAQANAAHDGHLTLAEAKSGYHSVARHFQDIDVDGKGYVTENDIRAWHALQKASHTHAKQADDSLRPRNAFQQHAYTQESRFNTSASQTVPLPADSLHQASEPPNQP